MLIASLMLLGGIILLPFAADWLVRGSSSLARRLGMSELVIGLTIVAIGTSAPELVTGVAAALRGAPGIVMGNAVGSNIANLGLVLGAGALFGRIPVKPRIVWFDGLLMVAITGLALWLAFDGAVSRLDGVILILCLAALTWWTIRRGDVPAEEAAESEQPVEAGWLVAVLLIAGVAGLAFGADILVKAATTMARHFGVSDILIGATVVALGTSLPELAASIAAIHRKRYGIMLGNLVGSCQFNLMAIIGIPAAIIPLEVSGPLLTLHLPALAVVSLLAWLTLYTKGMVLRREGAFLLAMYVAYIILSIKWS